jgi:hypothetical protein
VIKALRVSETDLNLSRQWRRQHQHFGGVQLGGSGGSLASAQHQRQRLNQQSTKSVGGNSVGNGEDKSDIDDHKNEGNGEAGSAAGSRQRRQPYFSVAAAAAQRRRRVRRRPGQQHGAGGGGSSTMVALAARWQRWQRCGRALGSEWRRRRERGGSGGGGVSTPAASSLAAAAAAWRQRGVGGGGTIDNQLKALAATASKMATITATTPR